MDLNGKFLNYCFADVVTEKTITDCYKLLVKIENRQDGLTLLQWKYVSAYLKIMRKHTPKELLNLFDRLLTPVIE